MLRLINIRAQAGISAYIAAAAECSSLGLNLDELLIDDPTSTYIGIADGQSMTGLGIYSGDILLITRATEVKHNDIIVCDLNGEFLCKQVDRKGGRLMSAAKGYEPYTLRPGDDFQVEGVVVRSIRLHRPVSDLV
ncbi:DNA polymerase V ['Osedax' symbiont bacterium Rs2_46_30_T18]|nr:DNA polymerase V ['Osedax' symbiont bacterium Rs2_46_30_T18]